MIPKSMTGFARSEGVTADLAWQWEGRSVNGRGLELRFRWPSGYDGLEREARSLCQDRLTRGNCNITLTLQRESAGGEIRLNEAALMQALRVARKASEATGMPLPSVESLLAMRGVVEMSDSEASDEQRTLQQQALLGGLAAMLDGLVAARASEGARLTDILSDQLQQMAGLVGQARNASGRQPEQIAARLAEQVARLVEAAGFDAERLHQEAVLIAAKADIQEELDRLDSHIAAARELLTAGGPVGRKLEFLAQEFNREANTICSKAGDIEISRLGLELKAVVDQFREQVANIE